MDNDFKMEENFYYPMIKEGDTGEFVQILQEKLKELDYYDESITGSFGPNTTNSVKRFQENHELYANGIVTKQTWNLLFELTNDKTKVSTIPTNPTLRLGSTGEYVIELQRILKTLLYYTGEINGKFDEQVERAVKSFQVNNRLTADGIVGRDTWSALDTLYKPLAICEDEIPGEDTFSYTVVAGDSLWSIARRFNTTVEELKRLNDLTSDVIFVGQVLQIPRQDSNPQPPNEIIYTVVAGDTLWRLANRFGTTVNAIKELNQLTSDNLSIGQILRIPTGDQVFRTYIVVAGDSLWSIARRFGTTVEELKRINRLTSDNLSIGQILLIP